MILSYRSLFEYLKRNKITPNVLTNYFSGYILYSISNKITIGGIGLKTFQRRNTYIQNKMLQLDKVADARKHTKRLARIMKYYELLTAIEVAEKREKLKRVFGELNKK